jgi:2-methylaconitate cis-trans-isomerase PrpF
MLVSKRALLATAAGLVIGLSTAAVAQTKKSTQATTMGEGEAIYVHPKGVHKSNVKVSGTQHEAAMKKGAREIKPGTVIYHQNGKLYMMEDNANEKASQHFQSNFDVDY